MQDRITQDTLAGVDFQRKPVTAAGGTSKRSRRLDGCWETRLPPPIPK